MILKLYVVDSGANVINKVLTGETIININPKKDFDIINPIIFLNGDFKEFNYCVIEDFNRSYFIDSIIQVNNKIVKLNCSCDVLETYKDDILNSKCRFNRSIKSGDYGVSNVELGKDKIIVKHSGNVTLQKVNSLIMVTIGVDNEL